MTASEDQKTAVYLTPREQEVITHLAQGYSYAQISAQLEITENTLKHQQSAC